ncbi:MAG: DUF4097 family beta strand repeat protein [Clostridia bacterium]|nr:DUF4097 family beta strand repeat protein [Clostridia bacterium]
MKPTSIIFIILSAILIVSGITVCIIGASMANEQNPLLCDSIEENGDEINTQLLDEFKLTDIVIDVKNMDVRFEQGSENRIVFRNINKVTYDLAIKDHKLSLTSVNPFEITSMIGFRENDGGFAGLRHYLYLNRYDKKVSEVVVYYTSDQSFANISISVKNGDVVLADLKGDTTYSLEATDGNIDCDNIITVNNIKANVKNGNFNFDRSSAKFLDFFVDNGNGSMLITKQFNFYCECEMGNIWLDSKKEDNDWVGVYPELQNQDQVEVPDMVKAKVVSGQLTIDTAELTEETEEIPEETPEETNTEE